LRASDLIALKVGDIRNWHGEFPEIRMMMKKTSDWLTIPLKPEALNHLEPYCIGKTPDDYVFNFYEGRKTKFDDPEEFEKDYKAILAYYNRQLDKLGIRAGLEKKLTSHVARNSYATSWISDGKDIYVLSKILGHSTLRQTEGYAALLNIPLHKAVRNLSGWGSQEVKGKILNQSF
jgi:integrase